MKTFSLPAICGLLVLSLPCVAVRAQSGPQQQGQRGETFRHASIEKAWSTAVAEKKTLLVMFKSDHCHYCTKMLAETFSHPGLQRMLAKDTETVVANAKDYEGLVKKMGIRGYPTTLLVSPEGEVLDLVEGFVDAKTFAKRVSPLLVRQTASRSGNSTSAVGR